MRPLWPDLVPHTGFEPVISALRGRRPGPLDECGRAARTDPSEPRPGHDATRAPVASQTAVAATRRIRSTPTASPARRQAACRCAPGGHCDRRQPLAPVEACTT